MTRFVNVMVVSALVSMVTANGRACAQDEAREILKKANAATKLVKRISYHAQFTGTGWVIKFVADVRGTTVMDGRSEWDIDRFRSKVKLRKPRKDDSDESTDGSKEKSKTEDPWSSEVQAYTAGSDGDVYFLIDPAAKMAYEDMDPAVLGSNGRNIQRLVLPQFSAEEPFKKELEAESVELIGTESVAGEDCYRLTIKTCETSPAAVDWYFSKKDWLPRKVVRIYNNRKDPEGEPGTTELTISRLVLNPKLSKNPFKLVVPPGFTKTDDFAP